MSTTKETDPYKYFEQKFKGQNADQSGSEDQSYDS